MSAASGSRRLYVWWTARRAGHSAPDPTQWTGRVVVALEGSTSEVSSLRDRLRDVLMFRPAIRACPPSPVGTSLDLAEVFRQSQLFEGRVSR